MPVLVGGNVRAAFERAAKWGIGWTAGGLPPDAAGASFERARQAWHAAGREGEPRLVALAYYGWGSDAREQATAYLGDYYGDHGREMAGALPVGPDELRSTISAFEAVGTDELILTPTNARLEQVEEVAEAALGPGR